MFDLLLGRFGCHFGLPNRAKTLTTIYPERPGFRSCDRLVPRWPSRPSKRALGGVLGRLGGVLGRSWGLLGPLWRVLGSFWAVLRGSWGALGGFGRRLGPLGRSFGVVLDVVLIHRFDSDAVSRFNDAIRRFDWFILFVASTHYFDSSIRLIDPIRRCDSCKR